MANEHKASNIDQDLNSLVRLTLKRFFVTLIPTLTIIWLFIEFVSQYIFKKQLLEGTGFLGFLVVLLICFSVSLFNVVIFLYKELWMQCETISQDQLEFQQEDKPLTNTLVSDLESAYDDENWEEVLKIGSVLSRPLWTTGKYKLRVKLGKLVEAAAAYREYPKEQASALIDDLGWTNVALGNINEAKTNILHGIDIAEANKEYYLAHKGYRHLSGISMNVDNLTDAETYLLKAKELSEKIEDQEIKDEVIAGLSVNKGILYMKRLSWEEALQWFETAQKMYRRIRDRDREVKLYHFKGDVLFGMNRFELAKDMYRRGLSASKKESRKDGILNNNLGIAKIALMEDDDQEAKKAYSEAAKVALELGLEDKAKELELKASQL